jgi:Kef-type K+ transport system membrane component KefB
LEIWEKIREISSTIMLGILVVEDIVVVTLLLCYRTSLLPTSFRLRQSLGVLIKLVDFIGGTLTIGYFVLPKAIDRIADSITMSYSTLSC